MVVGRWLPPRMVAEALEGTRCSEELELASVLEDELLLPAEEAEVEVYES